MTLRKLEANLTKRGGAVLRATHAHALKPLASGIEIQAAQPEGSVTFTAQAVVIADGGFQANMEMVRAIHLSRAREAAAAPRRHRDGRRAAHGAGARRGHDRHGEFLRPPAQPRRHEQSAALAAPADRRPRGGGDRRRSQGRRVADEGLGGIYLSNAIARLADPLSTTAIFDQAIWDGPPGRGHVQPPNPLLPEVGGTLHRADTIAELAALVGMPQLKETVDRYNAAIDAGTLAQLSPPRRGPAKAWPIRTAPFYAVPLCAAITNTMGGIVVNGDGAVLDTSDRPIRASTRRARRSAG